MRMSALQRIYFAGELFRILVNPSSAKLVGRQNSILLAANAGPRCEGSPIRWVRFRESRRDRRPRE
jgi:hypothetical protein